MLSGIYNYLVKNNPEARNIFASIDKYNQQRKDSKPKGLPLGVKILLEAKYGSKWRDKIRGKTIKIPFVPKKFEIEYEKVLLKYFKNHFTKQINKVSKEIINDIKTRQDDIRADMMEQRFYDSFDRIEKEANYAELGLEIIITHTARKLYDYHKEKFSYSIKKVFGIAIQLNDENVINNLPKWTKTNLNLIKNVRHEVIPKLKSQVTNAFQNGIRASELQEQIQKITGYTEYRAKLIARDQIGKLYGQMNRQCSTDLGLESYIWRTSGDERVRPRHRQLDGETRRWDEGIIPGEEIRCRCNGESVVDDKLLY